MALAAVTAMSSAGSTQESLPDYELSRIPVRDRPRPGYEPIGYRIGPTFFYPKLTGGVIYDSNVFATPTARSDLAFVISPQLTVKSSTPRFSHELDFGADIYRFRDFSSENRIDAHARYDGRAEIVQGLDVETRFEAARRHEERGESSAPRDTDTPVPYTDLRGEATLTRSVDRYGVAVNASARKLIYEDVNLMDGTPLDQSWRDGTIFSAYLKPFYEFSPGYRAFVRVRGNTRDYEGTGAFDRDSHGYELHAGLDFVVTPLISGTFEAGYLNQIYENPSLPATDGLSFAGTATWLFTPLMTVKFRAERKVAEATTPEPGFGARLDTSVAGQVDYELLRNVILSAGTKYTQEDFGGTDRTDKVIRATAGVDYLMNRHLKLGARYEYMQRDSSDPQFRYDRHTVMFNATAQH